MTLSLGMETHSSLMEFHIITNRTTPVPFLGILGSIFLLFQRGTYICAHAWIFFKLCIIMNHYIKTMKMYVLN